MKLSLGLKIPARVKIRKTLQTSKNEIYKLFFGTKSPEIKNGLIYHCGRVRQNILGAQACLNLLANLLDYEKNPECENYLVIFKMFHFGNIDQINLENHLKSNMKYDI